MTNKEILQIAMEQSAMDINCRADDFLKDAHVVVTKTELGPSTKKYYKEPVTCIMITYGSNIVRSAQNAVRSGFYPAWAEMTVSPKQIVDELNI